MVSSYDDESEEEEPAVTSPAEDVAMEDATGAKEEKSKKALDSKELQNRIDALKQENKKEKKKKRERSPSRRRRSKVELRSRTRSRLRRHRRSRSRRADRRAASVAFSRYDPPPEPLLPPKKGPAPEPSRPAPPPPPPPPLPPDGGKGNKKGPLEAPKKVCCRICKHLVSSKAQAAMDQHQYLNEYCLAVQAWNRFTPEQQKDPDMWMKAKEMAARMKLSREKGAALQEVDDLRGVSPCTVVSSRLGLRSPPKASASHVEPAHGPGPSKSEKKVRKKHDVVSGRDSRRRRRAVSPQDSSLSSSPEGRRRRKSQCVTINFR